MTAKASSGTKGSSGVLGGRSGLPFAQTVQHVEQGEDGVME